MKEYDFRFEGIVIAGSDDAEAAARLRELRDSILAIAGGFTEIAPGRLLDLVPGPGVGYIVELANRRQAWRLEDRLGALAARWGMPTPAVRRASSGPRGRFCFVLIPEKANEVLPSGERRELFTPERWVEIERSIGRRISHREFVYGEWSPIFGAARMTDELRMYFVRWTSPATETFLRRLIQSRVFDGRRQCDQVAVYLSVRGRAKLVYERRKGVRR